MSYCISPKCPKPADPQNAHNLVCRHCGSQLLLQGRYRVKQLLGEGRFGKTYEVDDRGTAKVLKVLLLNDPKALALLQQEARVLSQLLHPGIPKVEPDGYFTFFPKDRHQPLHCLVMEKIEGINLEEWQHQQNQALSQAQALSWLKQLVEILHQVHQQLYCHRDIKPSNIMLTRNGQLVLIDFGSAREVSHTSLVRVSSERDVISVTSPGYTPLEQANGKAVPQSDFFALGRTFVYLLTDKSPNDFPEDPRTGELLWQHRAPQVSKSVTDLIDDLMAPLPSNRPHNAQVILQRIAAIDHTWQPPHVPKQQPEFTDSLVSLRLEAFLRQHRGSSTGVKRVLTKVAKFKSSILIGSIVLSLGLAGTQVYGDLASLLSERFPVLSNQQWWPIKK
ncbi:MAG: serine/threonine protein kinase [Symplocastrum torsivum CPER-KK1]|jgi:serine/threonine protein kinase|uniref:non-specific serine/threonine protein kinase n=1 Tax=Symplocastrum torsivum CPER-KK1 TaxID=450513 RepID=A0A951PQC9_9CYAN|nr:serine/threonine protein kinase [Symplocastrum torsivum CPER-KK1]